MIKKKNFMCEIFTPYVFCLSCIKKLYFLIFTKTVAYASKGYVVVVVAYASNVDL